VSVLRDAATLIRRLAAEATPGPWRAGIEIQGVADVIGPNGEKVCQDGIDWPVVTVPNAGWIATMGPHLADHIAAWLDHEAAALDEWINVYALQRGLGERSNPGRDAALTIARDVLASQPNPTEETPNA